MPVYHEKMERQARKQEITESIRDPSLHRTKQREVSIERRPIISQDKPTVRRPNRNDPKTELTKKVTGTDSKNSRPSQVASVSPRTNSNKKPVAVKTQKPEEKLKVLPIKAVAKSSTVRSEPSSRLARKDPPIQKTEISKKATPRKSIEKIRLNENGGRREPKQAIKEPVPKEVKHERSRTRTLSPSEVRVLKEKSTEKVKLNPLAQNVISSTSAENAEAARILTDQSDHSKGENSTSESSSEYEDDFEDYESDFEDDSGDGEDTAVTNIVDKEEEELGDETLAVAARRRITLTSAEERERERKLDSGSYHISAGPLKREIEEIKTAMQNENRPQRKQSLVEEPDEGYLEEDKKNKHVFDFARAEQRSKQFENQTKLKKRGELLTQMISLDAVNFSLLEIPAVPYEVFIANFGRSNTSQVQSQTNEDDCEEGNQTDEIQQETRWTQMPPTYHKPDNLSVWTKEERMGVGREKGDGDVPDEYPSYPAINVAEFSKFIEKSSQKILMCLEERLNRSETRTLPSELSCCDSMLNLTSNNNNNVPISCIATEHNLLLTVGKICKWNTSIDIWSLLDLTIIHLLVCRKEVTTACFGPQNGNLVVAGATDGSINLWDLRESSSMHSHLQEGSASRSPTYTTAQVFKDGHKAPVVSLVVLKGNNSDKENDFTATQICSLSERGEIIIWTVVHVKTNTANHEDLGLAPWGRVRLVNTFNFDASGLVSRETKMDMINPYFPAMAAVNASELLIAESSGRVLYCSTDGTLLRHKYFLPGKTSRAALVTTLAVYPHDNRYFLAGCSDGTIRLHSTEQERPLICLHWNLQDTTSNLSVKSVFWMPNKPCMFIVLESNSRLHAWNLAESDIYPQFILPPMDNPFVSAAFVRSRHSTSSGSIVLGRTNGEVEIHNVHFEKEKAKETWRKEAKMFQKYVKIL